MDLIYTDKNYHPVGALSKPHGDFEISEEENTFEIKITDDEYMEAKGKGLTGSCLLYAPYTEIGGIVDTIKLNDGIISLCGRTWAGKLQNTIIRPRNEDYVKVTGTPSEIVDNIIKREGLDTFFIVDPSAGASFTYQFDRYTDVYTGLQKMCKQKGKRLKIIRDGDMCRISVADRVTHNCDFRRDSVRPKIEQNYTVVNHLICLGQGELQQRTVVDLYADADGNVSETQTIFGNDERTEVYDFSSAEYDDLIENGTERLEKYQEFGAVDLPIEDIDQLSMGDYISAIEPVTGMSVLAEVTSVIYRIDGGIIEPQYQTGVVQWSHPRH